MKEIVCLERLVSSKEGFHRFLANRLDFPEYYGQNLDALADCLEDVCEPTTITFERIRHDDDPTPLMEYLDRACMVLIRAARVNPQLSLTIRFENEG